MTNSWWACAMKRYDHMTSLCGNVLPNLSLVYPESYRLLSGESPILVTDRRPGGRQPVQPGDWLG